MQIENWAIYGAFSFFSTLAVYNGQRLFKSNRTHLTPWLRWVKRNQAIIFILVVFSSILASVFFLKVQKLNLLTFTLLLISGVISLFYVLRVGSRSLRELPFIKIHLIAFTWVVVLLVFPLLNESIDKGIVHYALAHYAYVVAITIPFDIRDLKYDLVGQKTIPQLLGITGSKVLSIILLFVYVGMMFNLRVELQTLPLFYIGVFVQLILILFMNERRSDVYCAGWIDGSISLIGASYFLL